ncbi:hypothetical protein ACLKA6_014998 [Drosophila palustris]
MPTQDLGKCPDPGIMNVLFEARRIRNSSSTSKHSSPRPSVSVSDVKKVRSKESLSLVEPPKHAKRVTFSKQRPVVKTTQQTTVKDTEMQTGLTSCLITNPTLDLRAAGGANNPAERKVGWLARTDSECQFKAPGIDFLTERDTNVITFEVKMRDSLQSVKDYTTKCDYFPKFVDKRPYKDQATQTLYRESSAQTVAYLPEIVDKEKVENLELFNLATLLPGDKPPGLYEVEILERARKRWAFNKALKTNFMKQLHEARESAIKSKYRPILEAFEWEQWIEREEYIQECQMMRLEIVICMFDKREQEMHNASRTRIEVACRTIEKRRQHGLTKNEIQYQRAMRRLQIEHSGTSRRWKKQSPMQALGSPCSEFYGPLIRHGVDPARRNFVGDGRKAFDMRIDNLEKRVNMDKLECPFTKLKEWSKPKEYVKEYEQNFCSDKHLQKLYESLKSLRSQATKHKTAPKCLKRRPKPPSEVDSRISFNYEDVDARDFFKDRARRTEGTDAARHEALSPEQLLAIQNFLEDEDRRKNSPDIAKQMLEERNHEDLEQLLHMYEGSTIGWIMQFLSEEMERLKEQRKLHFFSILAQKERWRREAAEAGLRQKENNMRTLYEDIFQQSNVVHNDVADDFINSILTTDMAHIAERDASEAVVTLAKQIDQDIQRWLESFKLIQTPLTYEPLREVLRGMVFPELNALVLKYEKTLIAKYIIDDVIFSRIWEEMETYDIASTLTSDLIDRLIDNDLYFFSTESESDTPYSTSYKEAKAILRKVIRQAVPGRRWMTETERIAHETYNTLFDDVFEGILQKMNMDLEPIEPVVVRQAFSRQVISGHDNIRELEAEKILERTKAESHGETDLENIIHLRTQVLSLLKKMKGDKITKDLVTDEKYIGDDKPQNADDLKDDQLVHRHVYNEVQAEQFADEEDVCSIQSIMDILKEEDFGALRHIMKKEQPKETSSSLSDIGVNFGNQGTQTKQEDQLIGAFNELIYTEGSEENTEYEADDERSWWNQEGEQEEEEDIYGVGTSQLEDGQESQVEKTLKNQLKESSEEPAQEPAQEPVQEPAQDPAEEPSQEPAQAPSNEPSNVPSMKSKIHSNQDSDEDLKTDEQLYNKSSDFLIDQENDAPKESRKNNPSTFFDARATKKFSVVTSNYDLSTAPQGTSDENAGLRSTGSHRE